MRHGSEASQLAGAAHIAAGRRWLDERVWTGKRPASARIRPGAAPGLRLRPTASELADGSLLAYFPSAALLDNGAADPRFYREVTLLGFAPGAEVLLRYTDPRTMVTRLEERRTADATGAIVIDPDDARGDAQHGGLGGGGDPGG